MRARTGRQLRGFGEGVIDALQAYRWPGNVRELENAIERAVVLTRGDHISLGDLPPAVRGVPPESAAGSGVIRFEVGQSLGALEREAILRTLDAVGGNREAAASILGIGTATLYRRLKEMEEDASP